MVSYFEKQDAYLRKVSAELDFDLDRVSAESLAGLAEYHATAHISIQVPAYAIESLCETGHWLTQHELSHLGRRNVTTGAFYPPQRTGYELEWFGPQPTSIVYGAWIPDGQRIPSPGHLTPGVGYRRPTDGPSRLWRHGEITFVLTDEVQERATIMFGDSFDWAVSPRTPYAGNPLAYVLYERAKGQIGNDQVEYPFTQLGAADLLRRNAPLPHHDCDTYAQYINAMHHALFVEASILGGVTLQDVAVAMVPSNEARFAARPLEDAGVPIQVYDRNEIACPS